MPQPLLLTVIRSNAAAVVALKSRVVSFGDMDRLAEEVGTNQSRGSS